MVSDEATKRYEDARARRLYLISEWEGLGMPVLSETGRSQHPLLRALNDIDALCARLERELVGVARAGRPSGAVSAPDRKSPPTARKLRSA